MDKKLNLVELFVLIFTFFIVAIGLVSARMDIGWFEEFYTAEDGFVENLTLLPLLICAFVGIRRWWSLREKRSRAFSMTLLIAVGFCIFVAGEEISWGQRLFDIESGDFFREHNAQRETNLHNLVVGDTKVNKLIFSQLLTVLIAAYLLLLPWAYRRYSFIRSNADRFGIPVSRNYQIIASLLLFVSIGLIPSGKNAEILEVGITFIFMLIFLFPENREVFQVAKNSRILWREGYDLERG